MCDMIAKVLANTGRSLVFVNICRKGTSAAVADRREGRNRARSLAHKGEGATAGGWFVSSRLAVRGATLAGADFISHGSKKTDEANALGVLEHIVSEPT